MNARRAAAVVLLMVATGALIRPAAASPIRWLAVQLGTHRFGHLTAPDAIIARAGPDEVGFECGKPSACTSEQPAAGGCGCIDVLPQGPTSFDVAPDGSIWLLDGVKHRLLVWERGQPTRLARSVPLPADVGDSDFVVGRDGTIYVFGSNVPRRPYLWLYALTRAGRVRWKAPTTVASSQAQLLVARDGIVYSAGPSASPTWTPLATSAGRPLPLALQRRRSSPLQPLTRKLRLLTTQVSQREAHVALVDRTHRIVRAWRITSRTNLALVRATSALVGGEVVAPLDVSRRSGSEHLVLKLGPTGAARQRIALDAHSVWDPDGSTARTTLRIGADGRLYQLRTDPAKGVTIARYSLGRD